MTKAGDPVFGVLLDLDGQVLVVDPEGGHWVRFAVRQVPVSPEKPHGIDYSLMLHGQMASDWSATTTPIPWPGRSAADRRTIDIGYGRLGLMSIATQRPSSRTSGARWTRCCEKEE